MSHQLTFDSIYNYGTEAIIVPVELEFADKLVRADAYIDTGATFCVFKRELAIALDINVESGTPLRFSTVTGGFDAYGHVVTVKTLGYSFDVTVYFAAFEAFTRNVLGRRGWLDQIQLGLVEYESILYLNRYGA
ncbi:MAG TPA: aspartyl protease family protein [Pyrinomonadaceae bacterium]|nr:aspartyl protease family protein [Pyrinomonadaceae bacterium]